MTQYVLAVDQGTTSTRAIIFDHSGSIVAVGQKDFTVAKVAAGSLILQFAHL